MPPIHLNIKENNKERKSLLTWYGGIYKKNKLKKRGLLYLSPGFLWLLVFLCLPTLFLIILSFATKGEYGEIVWNFSLDNYKKLIGYGYFGWSPMYFKILSKSFFIALITTIICVFLAFPLTFYIAQKPLKSRNWWLLLIIIPFWTNLVVRTYAWMIVLNPELPPAKIAAFLNLVPEGAALYPGSLAVYLGMVSTFLPFMALPLYANMERLNWELLEAARDLYASRFQVFRHAVLPQTSPGLTVGIIVTFIPAMAMFVVTDLLGAGKFMLIGNLIQQQFTQARDWPFGATICLSLMFITMILLAIYRIKYPIDNKNLNN